jgi:hypothetical protein
MKNGERKEAYKLDEENAYRWMLNSIITLTGFGLAGAAAYGWYFSTKGAILAVLASGLGFAIGGVAGFLFGFPRYTDSTPISSAGDIPTGTTNHPGPSLRHNTNLERITDWLMTMIIGATLVNLQELVAWAESHFRSITATLVYSGEVGHFPDPIDIYAMPGAVLVMPFMAAGFLYMYMWARKYLLSEWLNLDKALNAVVKLHENQKTQGKLIERLEAAQYGVDPTYLTRELQVLERFGVDEDAIGEIEERYKRSESWGDDPFEGFGPAEADGFRLSVAVAEDGSNKLNPYLLTITIDRADGAKFKGLVSILLHNSFRAPIVTDTTFNGVQFKQTVSSAEAFCLGAVVATEEPTRTTRLGLDLSKLPNLPPGFIPK